MSRQLQLMLIVISTIVFISIILFIRKNKLSTQMAVIWILWSIGLILISVFPELVYKLTALLGIMAPMNSLFLIMFFIIYCLVFFLYLKISVLESKLNSLAQHIAIKEKSE